MRSRPATPIRTQAHEGFSPLRDSRILAGPSNSRIVPMTASIRLLAGAVLLAVLVPALVCAQPAKTATKAPALASASEAKGIAADAYVFTYPLLQTYRELDRQMNQADAVDYVGQWNAFRHQDSLPGPKDATIRGRSYDAPLSWAWLDVRAEPVVVDIPAVPAARYVVFQFWDLWGHNLEHVGTKTAAGKATRVLVAGPAFKGSPPKGIDRVVRSSASLVGLRVRTSTAAPGDGASVAQLQRQYRITPWSVAQKRPPVKRGAPPALARWDDSKAGSAGFIGYVNALLPFVTPDPAEKVALARFAAIGIGPARAFDPSAIDSGIAAAIAAGVGEAEGKLEKAMAEARGAVDPVGTRDAFAGDPMKRAVSAGFELHRTARAELLEAPLTGDGGGDPFERGARYRLKFPTGKMPPADYFWSLEMIIVPQVRLVDNALGRYVIDSRMPGLKTAADGSIDLLIQRESPGGDLESNWLPAPDGGFSLTLRLYGPKPEAVDGRWRAPLPDRVMQ